MEKTGYRELIEYLLTAAVTFISKKLKMSNVPKVQLLSYRTESRIENSRPKAKVSSKWNNNRKLKNIQNYTIISPVPPLTPPIASPGSLKSPISFKSPTLKSPNSLTNYLPTSILKNTRKPSIRSECVKFNKLETESTSTTLPEVPVITPPNSFAHYKIVQVSVISSYCN